MSEMRGFRRVAALYDIHGNLPALESVLAEVASEGVDAVVVGGDVVPGPMPLEALDALRSLELPVRFIHGNGERDVLAMSRGEVPSRVPERFRPLLGWVLERLDPERIAWMASWPPTTVMAVEGLGDVLFCHATPRNDNEIFTAITPVERLAPVFEGVDARTVVCGHTHMAFDRKVGVRRVINAGSVGMPFGEPGAYWALLGPDVELRRSSYDMDAAVGRLERTGYPALDTLRIHEPPSAEAMRTAFEASALR